MSKAWPRLVCSTLVALIGCAAIEAQEINAPPSVVGSGARALGMGGAFIAVADDATAASWNPGGLTQLERPEISAVYSLKWLGEEWATTPRLYADEYMTDLRDINYLSIAYPFQRTIAGRNFVLSLNYQRKFDFDRAFDFRAKIPTSSFLGVNRVNVAFQQDGGLAALSPAVAIELTDKLSVGAVINLWNSELTGGNEWKSHTLRRTSLSGTIRAGGGLIPFTGFARYDTHQEYKDFDGINYTFGALYKPLERLSVGMVYHTKLESDVEYSRYDSFTPGAPILYRSQVDIDFPSAIGVGVAYRFPNDKLTLSLDVTRQDWDEFEKRDPKAMLITTGSLFSQRVSPVTNLPSFMSPHDPTYAVRLGAEYVFVDPTKPVQNYLPSLRAGLFYDPEPASGRKSHWWGIDLIGDGAPEDHYGVSIGAGLLIKNRVNIDAAYHYRWGNNTKRDTLVNEPIEPGFRIDTDQHAFYLSTVVYF